MRNSNCIAVHRFLYLILGVTTLLFASCKTEKDLYKRKYTDGKYHDFSFQRDKSDKCSPVDSSDNVVDHLVLSKMKEQVLPSLEELKATTQIPDPTVMLSEYHPLIAEKMDSIIARQLQKDSTWRTDTLPDAIATALSSQAMVGVGTIGGLATIAQPELIWFTIVPMIGIPFFLLISLVAAAIAMGKINRGEIDGRYRKWMRLWALCLLVNLILGSIVFLHFTA